MTIHAPPKTHLLRVAAELRLQAPLVRGHDVALRDNIKLLSVVPLHALHVARQAILPPDPPRAREVVDALVRHEFAELRGIEVAPPVPVEVAPGGPLEASAEEGVAHGVVPGRQKRSEREGVAVSGRESEGAAGRGREADEAKRGRHRDVGQRDIVAVGQRGWDSDCQWLTARDLERV